MPGGVPTLPVVPDEADFQKWKQQQTAKAPVSSPMAPVPDDAEFEAWKAKQAPSPNPGMTSLLTEQGILPGAARTTQERVKGETWSKRETKASPLTKALGTVAAAGRDIPGVEFLQTGARALVRGQSREQAFNEIRGAEESAPALARNTARLGGGVLAALAMRKVPGIVQGGPMVTGAQYGIAKGALSADPSLDVSGRVHEAFKEGAFGGVAGKVGEVGGTLARGLTSKTVGATNKLLRTGIKKADKINFGKAEAEAAAGGGTSPDVSTVLNHPLVKPLADDIRQSFTLQGKPLDDAAILMQARRELSQNQRALIDRVAGANSSRPLTQREIADVGAVKEMLTKAMSDGPSPLSPSFRPAVATSKELRGERGAFKNAVVVGRRIAKNADVPIKKLDTESAEELPDIIRAMTPGQAGAATKGVTGVMNKNMGFSANPLTGFGVGQSAVRANRLSPFLQLLDEQSGNRLPEIARALGITGTVGRFDK